MNISKISVRGRRGFLGVIALTSLALVSAQANTLYENTVLNDHPLAFYPLDLGLDSNAPVTPATDLSGNNITGTYSNIYSGFNDATGPTPFITNAVNFDGQTTDILLDTSANSNLLNFTGPITMEAWVQAQNSTVFGDIVGKGYDGTSEMEMRVNGNNGGNNYTGGSYNNNTGSRGATGGTQSSDWKHVVVANDGTNWTIYINGVAQQSNGDTVGAITVNAPWRIGNGSSQAANRWFSGNLSQVAFYNYGLPASQVLAHYFLGTYGVLPSNAVPIITQQPTPQTTFPGGTAVFTVGVLSAPATTNQWFSGANPLVGQTNATLTLANVQSAGTYSVVVGNKNGTTNSVSATLSLSPLGVYETTVLSDSPVAYYPIDQAFDTGNIATDVSGNGNNAVFSGQDSGFHNATGPTTYLTNAAAFNGQTSANMSTGPNAGVLNFSSAITEEAWVQPGNTSANLQNILAKGYDANQNYAEIQMREDSASFTGNGAQTSQGVAQSGVWAYVVDTCDGSTSKLYVNGVLVATGGSGIPNFVDPWVIGSGSASGNGRYFQGNITQVALYDHVLTAGQIYNHYYAAVNGVPATSLPPVLTTVPVAQSTYAGSSVQFSFAVNSAAPYTSQWFRGSTAIPGQTNATLTLLNVSSSDNNATFYVSVINANGTTNSTPVTLSVLTPTTVTPGNSLEWSANNNNGSWDHTSDNWLNLANSQQTNFNDSDRVLFDDAAGAPTGISLNEAVAPSTVTNNSTANSFSISGGGKITGGGSFTKAGGSTLEIAAANDFTGPFNVTGGKLQLDEPLTGSGTSYGATNGAPITVANGATLAINATGGYPAGNAGIIDAKLVKIAGDGVDGNGALQSVGNDIYHDGGGLFRNLVLTGDAKIGTANRIDLGHFGAFTSLTTGGSNYNLTFSVGSYAIWREIVIDPNLGNIDLFNTGGNSMDWYGMGQTGLGNPTNVLTIHPSFNLTFWHEAVGQDSGYAKIIHVMSGSSFSYRPSGGGGDYHLDTSLILDDGASWNFYNGDGGSNTGVTFGGTIALNGITHFSTGNSPLVYTNVISGVGGFVWQTYDHTATFTAVDTYQGPTALCDGRTLALTGIGSISQSTPIFFGGTDSTFTHLDVSGRTDGTLTLASGQTLGGIGRVNGNLVETSGATIAPAGTYSVGGIDVGTNAVGTISAANSVTLQGTTVLKLNGSGTSDGIQAVGGNISYGGTLSLVNINSAALAAGDSFQLFSAPGYTGGFSALSPTTPGAGLVWDTSKLLTTGRLSVIVPGSQRPTVTSVHVSGNNLVLSGNNGPTSGNYYVIATTNLTTPIANWMIISTNAFNADGTFGTTNAISAGTPKEFYAIKEQ